MTKQPVRTSGRALGKPKNVRRRFDRATFLDLGVRPFTVARCTLCRAPLCDSAGNPCWDIVGLKKEFVCAGGCRL